MVMCSEFERVDPKTLRIHPQNESVFGPAESELDQDFLRSLERDGILTPISITPDGLILSGHRRVAGAILLKIPSVPVVVYRDADDQTQNQIWISANLHREMTVEQRTRFFMKLRSIEAAAASNRQRAGVAVKSSAGRSADLAAEKVGMSRQTATRAAAVTDVIDKAEASGDVERAVALRTALNEGSVSSAYRMALQATPDSTAPEFDEAADVRTFTPSEAARFRSAYQVMIRTIDRSHHELEQLPRERHGQYVERLKSLVTDWQSEFPDLEWL